MAHLGKRLGSTQEICTRPRDSGWTIGRLEMQRLCGDYWPRREFTCKSRAAGVSVAAWKKGAPVARRVLPTVACRHRHVARTTRQSPLVCVLKSLFDRRIECLCAPGGFLE